MPKMISGGLRAPRGLSAIAVATGLLLATTGSDVLAAPRAAAPTDARIKDLGVAPASDVKAITIGLAVRDAKALVAAVQAVSDPASASFRKFVTPAQFAAQYGQSPATIAQVRGYLESRGFTITRVHENNLLISARATNAQIAAVFGTTVHRFTASGVPYQAPATTAVIPAQFSGVIAAVSGLSTRPFASSHRAQIPRSGVLANDTASALVVPKLGAAATATAGSYTVADLAAKYNVNPLYVKGFTGAGRTVGIATLAGYNQSDAYTYWSAVGLDVSPVRITDVLVDGGALADDGPGTRGAGETTLDVEQAGGLAPRADVRVYIAPNTGSGFIDLFAQAIDENLVDVLSVSWGSPEVANDPADLPIYNTIFLQAAVQGIPVIAASGDSGAFDVNGSYPYPDCSTLVSVDYPAADPYVLAAGGTTLPNSARHRHGVVAVPAERAWGWDYLKDYIVTYYGTGTYYADYLTVGGGGGVSVNFAKPSWQSDLAGTATSASAQSLLCGPTITGAAYADLIDMPAGVAGRNLPDVSLNADPYSGYLVYEGGYSDGNGGTSFVAPQLNGILTLISQGISPTPGNPRGRVGFPAPQFYAAFKASGYKAGSPFKPIATGDNGYYKATSTFNPATGLGSLDVEALAKALGAL